MPDITNLAATADLSAKVNEVKGKIPNISSLAFTAVLHAVENEIPDVNTLVKKATYDGNTSYIYIVGFVKERYFWDNLKNINRNVPSNKTKHVLI